MATKLRGARSARRALSVIAGTVAVVLVATAAPADASVTIDEFATPTSNSSPGGITVGPDGNVWFTQAFSISTGVGSITPDRTGTPPFGTNYSSGTGSRLGNVTTGPDGNLWFTVMGPTYDQIGRMSASTGVVFHRWTLTGDANNGVPPDIVTGPDQNLWFTENSIFEIGQITTKGVISQFSAGQCGSRGAPAQPGAITVGSDQNLWFTVSNCDEIGRITPSGTWTMYPITFRANDITAGPDGDVWFSGSGIGKIDPITGNFTALEFRDPGTSIAESPCASDLWFTSGTGSVGKITTSGAFSVYPLPTASSNPDDITAAPNGTVFATEPNGAGGQIARAVDTAALVPCVILLGNFRFTFPLVDLGHQGAMMHWMVQAAGTEGVADASGMNLFGFSPASGLPTPVPFGTSVSFQFNWAGTFPYDDPFDAAAPGGQVKVPIKVAQVVGASGADVTWASGDAPAGSGFDVQLKPPGGRDWITWQSGVTSLSALFGPSDPLWAGPGKYRFRSRLRQLTGSAASGYSAAKSITVS